MNKSASSDPAVRSGSSGSKRRLEPRFTPGWPRVPDLRLKMEFLCGYHPRFRHFGDVARDLKIPSSTLTVWFQGTTYEDDQSIGVLNPECIPPRHYPGFLALWGLPAWVIELENLDRFRETLETFEARLGAWTKLLQTLPDNNWIKVIAADATRGLIGPAGLKDRGLPQFKVGQDIMIRVANPGLSHGALMLQDKLRWACLLPDPLESTRVEAEMIYPPQAPDGPVQFSTIEAVGGIYRVVAIFTEGPLPPDVLEVLLASSEDRGSLNSAVPSLNRLISQKRCKMFSSRFFVTD